MMLCVARCGQNFFDPELCSKTFNERIQAYISKYEKVEAEKRDTALITEEIQNKVKEAIKKLHLALRESIALNSKESDWRPNLTVVYYGSYVSFLVQTELSRIRNLGYPITKPEDIDVAADRRAEEMCFQCSTQSDMMKRKTDAPPAHITDHENLPVNLSFYSNLHGRKVLDKCDSDITGINAVVIENGPDDFTVKLNWNPEFEKFIKTGKTTCALGHKATDATHIIRFLYKAIRGNYEFQFVNPQLKAKCMLTNHFFKPHLTKIEWLQQYLNDNSEDTSERTQTQCAEIRNLLKFPIKRGRREDDELKTTERGIANGIRYFDYPQKCMHSNCRQPGKKTGCKSCRFLYCIKCCQGQQPELAKQCSHHTNAVKRKRKQLIQRQADSSRQRTRDCADVS